MGKSRMNGAARKTHILEAALKIAEKYGLMNVKRPAVSQHAKVSEGLVQFHYNSMETLRRAVAELAVERNIKPVVAAGLALGYVPLEDLPEELRYALAESLVAGVHL
jgi:DNA-binding transcriptional regulator YbjK